MALIEFEEYKQKLNNLEPDIDELERAYDLEHAAEEVEELENRASEPGFWDDMEKSQKILQRTKALKDKIEGFHNLRTQWEDLLTLCELAIEAEDESMLEELETGFAELTDDLDRRKLATLLLGDYDSNNAILSFHAGAGGTEAQDWCEMLYRMYTRWAERHGFTYQILDYLEGDDAGLKSASILIQGENAYGFLKSESGVHRLVRVSPFDSSGRRHTSFSAVEVMPEIDDDNSVEIRPEDVDIVSPDEGMLKGEVTSVTFRGVHFEIIVDIENFKWMIQTTDEHKVGETVGLIIVPDAIHIMKKSKYSGLYGDYSSYSDEIDELNVIEDE